MNYRREPDGRLPFNVEIWTRKASKSLVGAPRIENENIERNGDAEDDC